MSQVITEKSTILNVDNKVLKDAAETLLRFHSGTLRVISKDHLSLYCSELSTYSVELKINEGQLEVAAEDFDVKRVTRIIDKYYIAQRAAEEYQADIMMNEEKDLLLMLEV